MPCRTCWSSAGVNHYYKHELNLNSCIGDVIVRQPRYNEIVMGTLRLALGLTALQLAMMISALPDPAIVAEGRIRRDPPIAPCHTCQHVSNHPRYKTEDSLACMILTGEPNILLTGQCKKYQCVNGYYYQFDEWQPVECVSSNIDPEVPLCQPHLAA